MKKPYILIVVGIVLMMGYVLERGLDGFVFSAGLICMNIGLIQLIKKK